MTTNSYIFAWDMHGIESIIPITQYEEWDRDRTFKLLKDEDPGRNPLYSIVQTLLLRARYNSHRHYEIYAVDCNFDIGEEEWRKIWEEDPQGTADLIRNRGQKIYSDRVNKCSVLIE